MSGTTTLSSPAAALGANAQAALGADDFLRHMTGMQAHYTPGGAGTTGAAPIYRLPPAVMALAGAGAETPVRGLMLQAALPAAAASGVLHRPAVPVVVNHPAVSRPALQAVAGPAMGDAQRSLLGFVEAHQRSVAAALGGATKPGGVPGFVAQMTALEAREQAEQAARLDAMFRALIAAGQGHPLLQPQILVTTNHAGGFLASVLGGAHGVLDAATRAIQGAPHAVEAAVHDAGQAVGQWATAASRSVGRFFGSLF